jgi:hypothetical protein
MYDYRYLCSSPACRASHKTPRLLITMGNPVAEVYFCMCLSLHTVGYGQLNFVRKKTGFLITPQFIPFVIHFQPFPRKHLNLASVILINSGIHFLNFPVSSQPCSGCCTIGCTRSYRKVTYFTSIWVPLLWSRLYRTAFQQLSSRPCGEELLLRVVPELRRPQ